MQQTISYSSSHELYLALCLLLPLISFIVSFLISDRYAWAISFTSPFFQLISACCAVVVYFRLSDTVYTVSIPWFNVGNLTFTATIQINALSSIMLPVVTIVSFLVHLYSTGYMAGNSGNRKYFAMLSFFTFSMLGIVLANDLLLLFVFWELVGFSSYMLIGHWMENPEAAASAKKAFLFNRIGDAGFLIGLMIIWAHVGSFDITQVLSSESHSLWKTAAALCIFGGVMGKSAQFPLFNWLPDAMIGPTPVSALIHAATMVAAGVFLLARLSPFFPGDALNVVAAIGIITAVLAALSALTQTDIKKILAYSTISQLGLMVTAVGVGAPDAAMIHLITHAFFKACLFLSAGSIIHVLHQAQHQSHGNFDVQDIRNLGGLRKKLPFTFSAFIVSGSALAGLPFFSGFLSKEAILSSVWLWAQNGSWQWIVLVSVFIVSFLTVLYTFRLVWFVFMGDEKATKDLSYSEAPMVMRMPLALLMTASGWFVVSLNPFDFRGWLFLQFGNENNPHFNLIAILSAGWVVLAMIAAYVLYKPATARVHSKILYHAYYLDSFYNLFIGKTSIAMAQASEKADTRWIDGILHYTTYITVTLSHLTAWLDKTVVDGFVHLSAAAARGIGMFTRSFQGGKIQLYIFWATLGLIIFLIWLLV